MKAIVAMLAAMVLFGFGSAPKAAAASDWVGTYTFDENGGKTAGGTVIYITHEIVIFEGDDGLFATVKSNGYQTSRDLMCRAVASGQKLSLYFESYGEENVFERYTKGELLLTLERKATKGKARLLTTWGKFRPVIERNEAGGKVYFVRSSENENN